MVVRRRVVKVLYTLREVGLFTLIPNYGVAVTFNHPLLASEPSRCRLPQITNGSQSFGKYRIYRKRCEFNSYGYFDDSLRRRASSRHIWFIVKCMIQLGRLRRIDSF